MSNSDRRTKMISLRLSEVEYDALKTQFRTFGAQNVSDLARLALQRIIHASAASNDDYAARLSELDSRVQALESRAALDWCVTQHRRSGRE